MGLKLRAAVPAVVGLGLAVTGVVAQRAQIQTPVTPATSAARTGNGYVDPALCAACHGEIAGHFSKTGMGRSFYRLKPENAVEDFGKPCYHAASDSYLVMFARGG